MRGMHRSVRHLRRKGGPNSQSGNVTSMSAGKRARSCCTLPHCHSVADLRIFYFILLKSRTAHRGQPAIVWQTNAERAACDTQADTTNRQRHNNSTTHSSKPIDASTNTQAQQVKGNHRQESRQKSNTNSTQTATRAQTGPRPVKVVWLTTLLMLP